MVSLGGGEVVGCLGFGGAGCFEQISRGDTWEENAPRLRIGVVCLRHCPSPELTQVLNCLFGRKLFEETLPSQTSSLLCAEKRMKAR